VRRFIIFLFLLLCCIQKGDLVEKIRSNPDEYLYPFDGFRYDNISVELKDETIYVKATCSELEGEDIYVFVNENGTLTLRSYCLEALPKVVKMRAVEIAMSNETIGRNAEGVVTVRRILPHTSAKFYIPKVLFSVTWHEERVVSALVDLDEGKVVRVYVSGYS